MNQDCLLSVCNGSVYTSSLHVLAYYNLYFTNTHCSCFEITKWIFEWFDASYTPAYVCMLHGLSRRETSLTTRSISKRCSAKRTNRDEKTHFSSDLLKALLGKTHKARKSKKDNKYSSGLLETLSKTAFKNQCKNLYISKFLHDRLNYTLA